jgi:peptidoglycan-associated lipoprotein
MKRLTFIAAMLLGTAAYAQTTAAPDDIKTYINDQITDAVTQLSNSITGHKSEVQAQIEILEKQMVELQSVIDEMTRRDLLNNSSAFFKFNEHVAIADSNATIDEIVKFMNDYPAYIVTIEGHADERGSREYNLQLGEKRAHSLKDALVAKGIDANRIRTISYGKERLLSLDGDEQAWALNRRGVFLLYK